MMPATTIRVTRLTAGALFAVATWAHAGPSPDISCALSEHGPVVHLYRYAKVGDSHRYAVQFGKEARHALFDSADDGDRGSSVKIACVGNRRARALIIQGEFFGSAYPKGLAIAWNPYVGKVQQIDFAERSFPSHIYLSADGAKVVLPNAGNEMKSPYIAYIYSDADRQTTTIPLDRLPVTSAMLINVLTKRP